MVCVLLGLAGWLAVLALSVCFKSVSVYSDGTVVSGCLGFCFLFLFVHLPKTC